MTGLSLEQDIQGLWSAGLHFISMFLLLFYMMEVLWSICGKFLFLGLDFFEPVVDYGISQCSLVYHRAGFDHSHCCLAKNLIFFIFVLFKPIFLLRHNFNNKKFLIASMFFSCLLTFKVFKFEICDFLLLLAKIRTWRSEFHRMLKLLTSSRFVCWRQVNKHSSRRLLWPW